MPITSRPACASGSAATPPPAPSPTMTTSVPLSLVAMMSTRRLAGARGGFREHLVVVRRLVIRRRLGAHPLIVGADQRAHARIADQIPAGEAGVAAVEGIAERALDRVRPNHCEE